MRPSFFIDFFLVGLVFCLTVGLVSYGELFASSSYAPIDLSFTSLPKYTFFSLTRGFIAYGCSLVFSLVWGIWASRDRIVEKVSIPLLDLLQSIPVLGFMPGLVLFFVWLFPDRNIGLELASILMIFTSQAWNMAFGVYQSVRSIPKEKTEGALIYRFSGWQRIKWLEIPSSVISLVWNSIMSMAGGWFFLMVSESFRLGSKNYQLPGLGSYMSVAAQKGDGLAMISAALAMVFLIVFLDQCLWRPLIVFAEKFRVETTASAAPESSWFLCFIRQSYLLTKVRAGVHYMKASLSRDKPKRESYFHSLVLLPYRYLVLGALLVLMGFGLVQLVDFLRQISLEEWLDLASLMTKTLSRVFLCVLISVLWALPLGLIVGLSKNLCKKIEPFLQMAASFPATLLFPAVIALFVSNGVSLQVGTVFLMLLGTGWYILFNVIAGVHAIPSELKEASREFHFSFLQRVGKLYVPAIFPYLVTGLITASGGAWNTSIVAEYVSYHGKTLTTPGLGSAISLAAEEGNLPVLAAAVTVMMIVVVLINYGVWIRLYRYAEKRFSLNY